MSWSICCIAAHTTGESREDGRGESQYEVTVFDLTGNQVGYQALSETKGAQLSFPHDWNLMY
jgi:hypothetical protein